MAEILYSFLPFVLLLGVLALVFWNLSLQARINGLTRRRRTILSPHLTIDERLTEVVQRLEQLTAAYFQLDSRLRRSIQRVGLVRFNSSQDMGGEQSFALALLDEEGNGVVINSLHGRSVTRLYVKTVEAGRSRQTLSQEEQQAIDNALSSTAPASQEANGPSP